MNKAVVTKVTQSVVTAPRQGNCAENPGRYFCPPSFCHCPMDRTARPPRRGAGRWQKNQRQKNSSEVLHFRASNVPRARVERGAWLGGGEADSNCQTGKSWSALAGQKTGSLSAASVWESSSPNSSPCPESAVAACGADGSSKPVWSKSSSGAMISARNRIGSSRVFGYGRPGFRAARKREVVTLSRNDSIRCRGACLPAGRSLADALFRLRIRAWTSHAPTPTDRLPRIHSYCRLNCMITAEGDPRWRPRVRSTQKMGQECSRCRSRPACKASGPPERVMPRIRTSRV